MDSRLTVVACQTPGGEPLALLANYPMHQVGVPGKLISPDYFKFFAEEIARQGCRSMPSRGSWRLCSACWNRSLAGSLLEAGGLRLTIEDNRRLALANAHARFAGTTPVALEKWQRLLVVHDRGGRRSIWTVGGKSLPSPGPGCPSGSRSKGQWEGRIDEPAVFARALRSV